jgi:glucose/arabinose dehydrogenase
MKLPMKYVFTALLLITASACASGERHHPFVSEDVARFDEPWGLAFLPDGRLLVTEKPGRLFAVTQDGAKTPISGIPEVAYGGQGGLGDVAIHPQFAENGMVYLSYAEAGEGDLRGAAVARGRLVLTGQAGKLTDVEVIWRQVPKVTGRGHYGHRLLFSADGHLFISSGERQKFDPSQDMNSNLGKILRLNDDGSLPADNPFADRGGVTAEIWSLGHRNPLGIAFDLDGQLWNTEMGPRGGDELNRVLRGENYGYPIVSNGRHYSGKDIPDHDTRPEFEPPKAWWTPVISPGGLMIYAGELFTQWRGDALIPGLSSQALVRVELDGDQAREVERFEMDKRIRAAVEGPDGAIWLLEDGSGGRLLKLTPR